MNKVITIYHGSENIIEKPVVGKGRINNDFGQGFYCTEDENLSKEWAVSSLRDGYSNCYSINVEYMKILKLTSSEYTILNWIATLLEHRLFSLNNPGARRAKQYLQENFALNVNAYDIIIGYRADDSYFDYADAFLNNSITVEQLAMAMRLGKLGEQVVIKSPYAFSCLCFEGYSVAAKDEFYVKRKARNDEANGMYFKLLEEECNGLYIQDIIRKGIKNDDSRIPRNIPE